MIAKGVTQTISQVVLSDVGSILNLIMQGSYKSIYGDPKYNELAQGDETFEVSLKDSTVICGPINRIILDLYFEIN